MSPAASSSALGHGLFAPHAGASPTPDIFPLSLVQENLWLVEQMAPGTSAYNLPQAWRLRGMVKVKALERAVQSLCDRHETLRTVFDVRSEKPVQIVLPRLPVPVEVVDLSHAADPEFELNRLLALEARRRFDLRRGPLVRFVLYRFGAQDHALLLNVHHLICDDWSFGVLLRELADLYSCALAERQPNLPPLPIQYADFAVWQRDQLESASLESALSFWKGQLQPPLESLLLNADRPRPALRNFHGTTRFFKLDRELHEALLELSRAQGVTLFMTLLAGFQTLLHRYSRQSDIVVGSPMAGRERIETEGLIGLFVNTHALRGDFSGDPCFTELLNRIRETVLGAVAHQAVAESQILQSLRADAGSKPGELFRTVFGLQPPAPERWVLPGLETSRIELDNGGAKFELTVLLYETDDGLRGRCEYSDEIFESETIARLMKHFELLLRSIVAKPQGRVSEFALLDASERQQLLDYGNPVFSRPVAGSCIHQVFARQAERSPDGIAVSSGQRRLTYRQLNELAEGWAGSLRQWGIGPGVPVALCLERSVELVAAILAVLKAGGSYVPVDPAAPKERMAFMLKDTGAAVLLTQQHLRQVVPPGPTPVLYLENLSQNLAASQEEPRDPRVKPSDCAYVIYTSGSTGRPKGVQVSHQNVVRLFQQTEPWFNFNESDVWTLFHSYTFDFSVWEIWGALLYGGRLIIVPQVVTRSPGEFYDLLLREKVTVLNQTPSAFRQLIWAEHSRCVSGDLSLRYVICGGEALDPQSLKPWFERHGDDQPRVINMYGITETTVHVTYRRIRQEDVRRRLGSVLGVPIPDLRVYLLDEHLQPVPLGVPGEICVGGAGLARGYLNRPELTAARFVADPFSSSPGARLYLSGDLARRTSSGELEYLGRKDQQVKIRGFRVELGEIESTLNGHPAIRESVVLEREFAGDKRLVAYFVPLAEAPALADLREHLGRHLPDYMIPAHFCPLQTLPLTSNGKLDRRALPSIDFSLGSGAQSSLPPRNPLEKLIAGIWSQVLGHEVADVHSNFFSLGGHSLLATRVISRLAAALNLDLSVRLLFESPTIAELANTVAQLQPGANGAIRRRAQPSKSPEPFAGCSTTQAGRVEAIPEGLNAFGFLK